MRPRFARFSTVKSRRGTTVIPTATRAISPRMVPFTNIRGMFFTGHQEFRDRHEAIFKGEFRGTSLKQETVSLRFIRPDVAIAETLTWVSGFSKAGPPPGTQLDANGRLRTRLLQVLKKDGGVWKIVVYHNVDIKPGVPVPESR
jgi:uncharacterized protein (TIGR02246 family)